MTQRWEPSRIGHLEGTTAIVTGANSGLGLRTATRLAEHGTNVVLACRDPGRGAAALAGLRAEVPAANQRTALAELDLADLASIRRFAATWGERRLDLLINNAGVMAIPQRVSADGFEMQLATNHLGHFALTGLLLPSLLSGSVADGPARVVTLSSFLHRYGRMHVTDLMLTRNYSPWRAYCQSKLANLLFMGELNRRARAASVRLTSAAAHPGYASTNLQAVGPRMSGSAARERLFNAATRVMAQPPDPGAWPTLRAASDPTVRGGEYFGPGGIAEWRGAPERVEMSGPAKDLVTADWLWEQSVALTGVDYAGLGSGRTS